MSSLRSGTCLPAIVFAGSLFAGSAPAAAQTTSILDLSAGLGYSSNAFETIPSQSSSFGRLAAFGLHSWRSERGATSLTGYVEDTTYFNGYGSKQIFSVNAHTTQALSEHATVYGDLGASGDFAGQLSNRLTFVPSQPPVTEPGNPLPPPNTNPDVFGLSGREYTLTGQVGAAFRTSPKGTLSVSAGAERLIFTGTNHPADYNVFYGSAGYTQQVSEHTSVGGTLYLQRQDFTAGNYSNIVNPVLTVHSQLSETLTFIGGVGVMIIDEHHAGQSHSSATPSFSAGLCSTRKESRICARFQRDAQSALGTPIGNQAGQSAVSTRLSADYYHRLSEQSTIQASLSAVRYSTLEPLNGEKFHTDYISAVAGYDRRIGRRFAVGVTGGVRKLYRPGPDPTIDINGQVYLRYRLGDIL